MNDVGEQPSELCYTQQDQDKPHHLAFLDVWYREPQAVTPRAGRQKGQRLASLAEWDCRGDGPALGALFLVNLLGQAAEFQLADFSLAILRAAAFESPSGMHLSSFLFTEPSSLSASPLRGRLFIRTVICC